MGTFHASTAAGQEGLGTSAAGLWLQAVRGILGQQMVASEVSVYLAHQVLPHLRALLVLLKDVHGRSKYGKTPEPRHEKTNISHMQKQRRRSASR